VNSREIELLVNRLHAMFPTQAIAKNTILETWRKDVKLLGCSASDGKAALQKLRTDPNFPSLHRVVSVFDQISESRKMNNSRCKDCDDSGMVMDCMIEVQGREVQAWKKCHCQN
jgi:hypothetical protein